MKPLMFSVAFLTCCTVITGQENSNAIRAAQKFRSGGSIRMHLSGGGYTISGTDSDAIVVTYGANTLQRAKEVNVKITTSDSEAKVSIHNTPHNNFQATIEIPRHSDLWVRLTAGDLNIEDVEGSKDVESHAGNVEIKISHPEQYGHRDASVLAGDLDASAFDVSKSGIFRSFEQEGKGPYHLHAHVGAGNLTLRGTN